MHKHTVARRLTMIIMEIIGRATKKMAAWEVG